MKFLILSVLVACAAAAPAEKDAQVLRSEFVQTPEGNFNILVETENGINSQVSGAVKQFDKDTAAVVQSGSSSYVAPDGQKIEIVFTADENGYHAEGAHLPTPPPTEPLPPQVLRTLEYIAAHPHVAAKGQ